MGRRKQPDDAENGFAEWGGYMGAKVQKLQQQFRAESAKNNPFKKSDLFAGISIHVNGLTNPTADELKRIMMLHGGMYDTYLRPSATTFIIAQNLPDVKIRQLQSSKKLVISPDWIVDCVKEERLLDYSKYLLYTNARTNQPKIGFQRIEANDTFVRGQVDIKLDNKDLFKLDVDNESKQNPQSDTKPGADSTTKLETDYCENWENIQEQQHDNSFAEQFQSFLVDDMDEDMFSIEDDTEFSAETVLSPLENPSESKDVGLVANDFQLLNFQIRNAVRQPIENNSDSSVTEVNKSVPTKSKALSAVDPNFLAEFYNNSRLHHIATLSAGFKNHISILRESSTGLFPGISELCRKYSTKPTGDTTAPETIMHIDMDCFFVSVGLRDRPHLRGQPVAVTHSNGGRNASIRPGADPQRERAMYNARHQNSINGSTENRMETKTTSNLELDGSDSLAEIASCSYEARRMGLKNGMFVGAALKLCPNLKTIPYDFEQYKIVAHSLYNTLAKYTLDIEAVSCDEMYVNLRSVLQTTGMTSEDFVTHIRNEIQTLTGCPCSAGVGANRLQARMATKQAKPNGQFFLHTLDVEEYFSQIAISDLPGVGYSTTQKLNQLGWHTCADLRNVSLDKVQNELGKKFGETIHQYCRGIDPKPLVYGQVRKSVSAEVNYGIRFTVETEFDSFLQQLCAEVHSRLAEIRQSGKSITLKLMVRAADAPVETAKFLGHGVCDVVTKTTTLKDFTNDAEIIQRTVFDIKNGLGVDVRELRGVGIHISKLDGGAAGGAKQLKPKSNRLKEMFELAVQMQRNVVETKPPTHINHDSIIPDEPKRQLRSQRALSVSKTTKNNNNATVTTGRPGRPKRGAANSRGVGRGTTRQKSVTELMVKQTNVDTNHPDNQLDMAVLAELPDEIREEALRAFRLNNQKKQCSKPIKPDETIKNGYSGDSENLCDLDADFLAALPDDIRAEVVREQKANQQQKQQQRDEQRSINESSLNSNQEFLAALPDDLRAEVERDTKIQLHRDQRKAEDAILKTCSIQQHFEDDELNEDDELCADQPEDEQSENVFLQKDWRSVLQNWIDSVRSHDDESAGPIQCDVEVISQYATEMVRLRKINEIYLCFRYLFRIIAEKRKCVWHQTYTQIVADLQAEMLNTYGSKLQVKCDFDCSTCGPVK